MSKDLHDNSTLSYNEQKEKGRCHHFRRAIFDLLCKSAMTDRELMEALKEPDVNNIRPEVTRLKQDGLVQEVGSKICQWTKKKVRVSTACSTVYRERQKKKGDPPPSPFAI